ncbi:MAG: hypothetical protein AUK47_03165 [Deltaproteobacteria bacterium CG2_30_63_29]|nr:MAG: hypothetical protein AUK47_03165 [Deltaproteobacteria bacterium CG2_30_63_29]PJB36124.1 MAG: hypothetical protein CO108_24115 [Deltaproteobacteria bacterium CG_4_9_14_3_um_filter_63_12]
MNGLRPLLLAAVFFAATLLPACKDDGDRLVDRMSDLDALVMQNNWSCTAMASALDTWALEHETELTTLLESLQASGELAEVAERIEGLDGHDRALAALEKCSTEPKLSRALLRLARILGAVSDTKARS